MEDRLKLKLLAVFSGIYIILLTRLALQIKNYEILYYSIILYVGIIIILFLYKDKIKLQFYHYFLISILWLANLLGSNIYLNGTKLYDTWLFFIRYDQIMHIFGCFVITLLIYNLFKKYLKKLFHQNELMFLLTLVLITLGIGAVYEIIELFAAYFLNASEAVGTYYNNALDLLFNLTGSIFAAVWLIRKNKL
jgi:hypothetical protein